MTRAEVLDYLRRRNVLKPGDDRYQLLGITSIFALKITRNSREKVIRIRVHENGHIEEFKPLAIPLSDRSRLIGEMRQAGISAHEIAFLLGLTQTTVAIYADELNGARSRAGKRSERRALQAPMTPDHQGSGGNPEA